MEKIAFRMFLKPGHVAAYRQRHDAIWPELAALLTASGISDYSIYLDENSLVEGHQVLFAVLQRTPGHSMDALPQHPVMQRWWAYMSDIMAAKPDNSPISTPLKEVFYLK